MDAPIQVVGVGMSRADVSAAQLSVIQGADTLVGGRRLLEWFPEARGERMVIGRDLEALTAGIARRLPAGQVVVLASGDPLCHGIGSLLMERFGQAQVKVWPNVSCLATAFARIGAAWHDARLVSLHGRAALDDLHAALRQQAWVAVLTDPRHTPAWIASHLLERGAAAWRLCVLEHLGSPQERIRWLELPDAAAGVFRDPNIVVLQRMGAAAAPRLGLPDECLAHEAGLITKAELRAVAIAKLALRPHHCLWDLGAGSGALSIEAAAIVTHGALLAIERRAERCAQIRENRRRFGVVNLDVIQAELPRGLTGLPAPDRVFIGGGGGKLGSIFAAAARALKPDGRIVAHCVLLESLEACRQALDALAWSGEVLQLQVNRSKPMPWGRRLAADNPIWVVSGQKPSSG
jgi:precorrin-6Y C5,15-methyltransferase (decarboxylating)